MDTDQGPQAVDDVPAVAEVRWYNLVIECTDPRRLADFWLAVLGWREAYASADEVGIEAPGDPEERTPAMVFWRTGNVRRGKNRLHVDLRAADLAAAANRLVRLGATVADVGQSPDAKWIVLADPEGNVFCVQPSA
ncbi:MAG TPA: VOC family protein [Streptosporangiaceae bacterium]|nr:VOC family protein [Streptosporangiaceae bacterium]